VAASNNNPASPRGTLRITRRRTRFVYDTRSPASLIYLLH